MYNNKIKKSKRQTKNEKLIIREFLFEYTKILEKYEDRLSEKVA